MSQIERRAAATVPNLDGRGRATSGRRLVPSPVAYLAPVPIVVLGVVATVAWTAFLGWCVFSLVRWAIG